MNESSSQIGCATDSQEGAHAQGFALLAERGSAKAKLKDFSTGSSAYLGPNRGEALHSFDKGKRLQTSCNKIIFIYLLLTRQITTQSLSNSTNEFLLIQDLGGKTQPLCHIHSRCRQIDRVNNVGRRIPMTIFTKIQRFASKKVHPEDVAQARERKPPRQQLHWPS